MEMLFFLIIIIQLGYIIFREHQIMAERKDLYSRFMAKDLKDYNCCSKQSREPPSPGGSFYKPKEGED